jgi:amidohydrolase
MLRFLSEHTNPTKIVRHIGGNGFLATYNSKNPGPTIVLRAELDALPISENSSLLHRSKIFGASHKSGHDGHMATLAALGVLLKRNPVPIGRVILLFQPSEETGKGALAFLDDKRLSRYTPDYVFTLQNVPGFSFGDILIRDGVFTAASAGLEISLYGKSAHPSTPELGVNPMYAVAEMVEDLKRYSIEDVPNGKNNLVTPVHCRVGNPGFGTSPDVAQLFLSLRANTIADFKLLKKQVLGSISSKAHKYGLKYDTLWKEEFPNVRSNAECNLLLRECAEALDMNVMQVPQPFQWSDDFGHFTQKFTGAMFGVGAGVTHPPIHSPEYDFPDELLKTGATFLHKLVFSIATKALKNAGVEKASAG